MTSHCIVVIGHVDHGKTSLVRALTGIETDRLAEEKARGLSIALGFAHRTYPTGTIDFIDAPGHEDFIAAMVSGATGAQSVLAVISLTEGIRAQTLEHLNIAGMLGLTNAVVAVTKSDLLDPAAHAAQLDNIRRELSQTPFAHAELIPCSAHKGHGIEALDTALQQTLNRPSTAPAPLQSFLPIDRVFSMQGHGTVVTGTLLGHALDVNTNVTLHPAGQSTTIRGLQCRSEQRETVQAGERVAVNLRGLAAKDIARGDVLCAGKALAPSMSFDVAIDLHAGANAVLKHNEDIRVMFGTSSEIASVRIFGAKQIAPEHAGYAQLRFKKPVVGFAGQKAVLRHLSPARTIGGATILDPLAIPTKSGDTGRLAVLQAVEARDIVLIAKALSEASGGVTNMSEVARLSRVTPDTAERYISDHFGTLGPDIISPIETIDAFETDALKALEAYHIHHPFDPMAVRQFVFKGMSQALINYVLPKLVASGKVRQEGARVALFDHDPKAKLDDGLRARLAEIETLVRQSGLSPLMPEEIMQNHLDFDLIAIHVDEGTLGSLENIALKQTLVFHADVLRSAATNLRAAFPFPQTFTTSEARTALGTSRRVIVPVLEYFDAQRVTVRDGDARQVNQANSVSTSGLI